LAAEVLGPPFFGHIEFLAKRCHPDARHSTIMVVEEGRVHAEQEQQMKAQTMTVQLIRQNGGPEVFEAAEMQRPAAGSGQVLVRVAASSVNTADLMARSMGPVVDFIPTPPAVLGMDFAGTVAAVGSDVEGYAIGDAVYGCAGGVAQHQGTLAEYLAADVRLIARKPASLSMVQAAALPLVSITAFEALFDRMGLTAGQTVLVHGGAGGVGHVAVQLAVAAGARVFASAQSANVAETSTPADNYRPGRLCWRR